MDPMGDNLTQALLNHPSTLPPGLTALDSRDVRVLARQLLENRAVQHQLPAQIMQFNTGWQHLLWADGLHQAATLLWLDQLATLYPAEAGRYALAPELRQMLDLAEATAAAAPSTPVEAP